MENDMIFRINQKEYFIVIFLIDIIGDILSNNVNS